MRVSYCFLVFWFLGLWMSEGAAQQVRGRLVHVHEAQADPLGFGLVLVQGTQKGATANAEGYYLLDRLPVGTVTLEFRVSGYKTLTRTVSLSKDQILDMGTVALEEDYFNLDAVVVSATRHAVDRRSAPVVVQVSDQRTFQAAQAVSLAEGLRFQPGLRVENNCQNCGFTQVRLNGLAGPYAQILINSRPIFSALNGVYGLEQLPTYLVDRVEVIRGGGSALFGANAVAGTINVLLREPTATQAEVSSNFSLLRGHTWDNTFNMAASAVSQDRKAGITLFGVNRHRNGFDANGDGFTELTKLRGNTVGASAFYKPSALQRLTAESYLVDEYRRGGNRLDLAPHEADIAEELRHRTWVGGTAYEFYLPAMQDRFSVYLSGQRTLRDSYYGAGQDPNAYGTTTDASLTAGVQYVREWGKTFTLTLGSELQRNQVHDRMPGYNRDLRQTVRVWGTYVQGQWKMTNKTTLLLGLRGDRHNLMPKAIFSPRVNVLHQFSTGMQGRLTYSQGFRAPQAFDEDLHIAAVGGQAQLIRLSDRLRHERSQSVSGSLDWSKTSGRHLVGLTLEGFWTVLERPFVLEEAGSDAEGNMILEKRNGAGAIVAGTNLEAKWAWAEQWQAQAGWTWQIADLQQAQAWSDNAALATRRMLRTPRAYGYWLITWQPAKRWNCAFTGNYTGPMEVPHFAGYVAEDRLVQTPAFAELNLKISRTFYLADAQKWPFQLSGGIQNLLDSYQRDFDQGPLRDAGYVYGPLRPRTFFVGVRFGGLN